MTLDQPRLDAWVGDHLQRVIDVRHDLHAHPELAFDTPLTCHALATELRTSGLEPVSIRGGLYVDIGPGAPRVALRADIDALPLQEETGLPYASVFEGRMHACGHDVHAAVALGAALALADQPSLPAGVRVIFQPAEEVLGGALSAIDAGAADGIEQMFALHCEPHHDVGTAGTVRVLSLDAWRDCERLVRSWIDEMVGGSGADVTIDYAVGVPPVENDPEAAFALRQAIASVVGHAGTFVPEQSMGGEDFAWYGERCRIALARLGVRAPGTQTTDLHQGAFVADDGAIEVGVRIMVAAAIDAGADLVDEGLDGPSERVAGPVS